MFDRRFYCSFTAIVRLRRKRLYKNDAILLSFWRPTGSFWIGSYKGDAGIGNANIS